MIKLCPIITALLIVASMAYAQIPPRVFDDYLIIKRWPAVSSGLVGYYRFNNDNWVDAITFLAGNKNGNVTIISPGFRTSEYAARFGGTTNDYVAIVNSGLLNNCAAWTIGLMAFPHRLQDNNTFIFSYANLKGGGILQKGSGSIRAIVQSDAVPNYYRARTTGAGIISTGAWQHIAAVFDKSVNDGLPTLYVNGINVGGVADINSGTYSFLEQTGPFYVGTLFGFSNFASDMNVNDVCLYNRALSSNEVLTLYQGFNSP